MAGKLEDYLPEGHLPHAQSFSTVYPQAAEELLKPYPSVQFRHFPKLNQLTGGLRPHEYSILCGATGLGKTTLLANIARDLVEQQVPTFIASVETGAPDFLKRMMSVFVGRDWNTGDAIAVKDVKDFHIAHGRHFQNEKAWLSLYDSRIRLQSILADLAYYVIHHGVKVAMIDNLNFLMEITRSQDTVVEMDRVTHELIMFVKRAPIHIIMVMHPKKTDGGRVESEFDVKGSSTAVQEAHNVFLFNRASPGLITQNLATEWDRELMIAKMRRRGKYVRRKLLLKCANGVQYEEGQVY